MQFLLFLFIFKFSCCVSFADHGLSPRVALNPGNALNSAVTLNLRDPLNSKDQKTWHRLLHYKKTLKGYKSSVLSEKFFYHKKGRFRPDLELEKSLSVFTSSNVENPNAHPMCLFPARFAFLKKNYPLKFKNTPQLKCERYDKWVDEQSVTSISLLFASGYLSNPASYYGHTLIRLNSKSVNSLLLKSVNFGAQVPPKEGPVTYMLKGLFGGYSASFSDATSNRHNTIYGETEFRDMFSYELDFNDDQKKKFVRHLWEILGFNFQYFFLKQNCAYRMIELIEVAFDKDLLNKNVLHRLKPWMLPVEAFYAISKEQKRFSKINFIPSLQTRFYERYSSLSSKQKSAFKEKLFKKTTDNTSFLELDSTDKATVIKTALDFTKYKGKNKFIGTKRREILIENFKHTEKPKKLEFNMDKNIHDSQKPSLLSLIYLYNSKFKNAGSLRLRFAYYDFLGEPLAFKSGSSLTMFDLKFKYFIDMPINENNFFVSDFDLVYMDNLNALKFNLKYDPQWSWSYRLGLDQYSLSCLDCSQAFFSLGFGKAFEFKSLKLYSDLQVRLQSNTHSSGYVAQDVRVGLIYFPSLFFRLNIETKYRRYYQNTELSRWLTSIETRTRLSRNIELSAKFEKNQSVESSLGLQFYW